MSDYESYWRPTVAKKRAEPAPASKKGQMAANVRVPEEFMAIGKAIAEHHGLESVTGAIRFLFLREYREVVEPARMWAAQAAKAKGEES